MTGNVCAKPEAFTTQKGISQSKFKLAVQRKYKNADGNYDADFFPVIAWRQTADFCNRYLDKGSKVAVEGTLQTRQYDAQDGSKRYITEIIADHVESFTRREPSEPQKGQFVEVDPGDELPF